MAADKSKGQALRTLIAKLVPQLLALLMGWKFRPPVSKPAERISEYRTFSFTAYTISGAIRLLEDRMPAAFAVVGGRIVTPPVVVIEHEMLAFVAHKVGNTCEIGYVVGDNERHFVL